MKNSIQCLKTMLLKEEKLSLEQLNSIKGGCGSPNDPKRCNNAKSKDTKLKTKF